MSDIKNDGGPAFPICIPGAEAGGMTLRDWFAGMALNGLLANGKPFVDCPAPTQDHYAIASYTVADSMIAERPKP